MHHNILNHVRIENIQYLVMHFLFNFIPFSSEQSRLLPPEGGRGWVVLAAGAAFYLLSGVIFYPQGKAAWVYEKLGGWLAG